MPPPPPFFFDVSANSNSFYSIQNSDFSTNLRDVCFFLLLSANKMKWRCYPADALQMLLDGG